MEEFICTKCNKSFKRKLHLQAHENKKNPCNITKVIECEHCNKTFTRTTTLKSHLLICKVKINLDMTKKMQVMEDNIIELKNENNKLKSLTIHTQNNTNCNNTNIINNNITIKVSRFGFERRDKLTPEENKDIIDGGKNCLLRCISTFHFNKRLPEYRNVLFSNLKSSTGLIYALNKTIHPEWLAQDIDEIIDTLIKCRSEDVKDILEDTQNKLLIDTISRFKIDAVKEYLDLYETVNQKEEKKIKKAIKLHLYNNRKMVDVKTIKQ